MQSFRDLRIWKLGIKLVKSIYATTQTYPKSELYGLSSQMQRAAVSIPSNIAEGHIRAHRKVFIQFLQISLSSAAELETQLIISGELNYLDTDTLKSLTEMIHALSKQIRSLINKLKAKP
ncbi:four helix bundle protein [bacterium]|nr:four helix bundle protein [bacterium]MBU1651379.1 four helix bundle protein [bacterium]MBU1882235.1 four helix bundle protein [bacterium]